MGSKSSRYIESGTDDNPAKKSEIDTLFSGKGVHSESAVCSRYQRDLEIVIPYNILSPFGRKEIQHGVLDS